MVSLKEDYSGCSSRIPEIREPMSRCLLCGYLSDPIIVNREWIAEPKACLKEECLTGNSRTIVINHDQCRFVDRWIERVEEKLHEIHGGGTPYAESLLVHDKLMDARKPCDKVA